MRIDRLVGVISGMGPGAGILLQQRIMLAAVNGLANGAEPCDQIHVPTLVISLPQTPDRTNFLLGVSQESPVRNLLNAVDTLADGGAQCFGMACVTAHHWWPEIAAHSSGRMESISILDLVAAKAKSMGCTEENSLVILGTLGSKASGALVKAASEAGVKAIWPSEETCIEIMDLIGQIKKSDGLGGYTEFSDRLGGLIIKAQHETGATVSALCCTELSLPPRERHFLTVDAIEELAEALYLWWRSR